MVSRPKILIVEDETIVAMDIKQMLEGLGYDVSAVVSSGEESLKKASDLNLDLVLMDIKLKGKIDGLTAAQRIYQRFKVPIIYISAYGDQSTIKKSNKIRHFGFIHKPFEERELQSVIRKVFMESRD